MSQAELAALLSINQKSLHALEASEAKKTIRLDSLEKVADALDYDLVYALVPAIVWRTITATALA